MYFEPWVDIKKKGRGVNKELSIGPQNVIQYQYPFLTTDRIMQHSTLHTESNRVIYIEYKPVFCAYEEIVSMTELSLCNSPELDSKIWLIPLGVSSWEGAGSSTEHYLYLSYFEKF